MTNSGFDEIEAKKGGAPRLGFEPRTLKLTASCSTIELSRIKTFGEERLIHSIADQLSKNLGYSEW